ncbi:MAG: outer membrane beta-barrel protein [Bacteroidota bacterium]
MSHTNHNWERIGRMLEQYQPEVPQELSFDFLQKKVSKAPKWSFKWRYFLVGLLTILAIGGFAGLFLLKNIADSYESGHSPSSKGGTDSDPFEISIEKAEPRSKEQIPFNDQIIEQGQENTFGLTRSTSVEHNMISPDHLQNGIVGESSQNHIGSSQTSQRDSGLAPDSDTIVGSSEENTTLRNAQYQLGPVEPRLSIPLAMLPVLRRSITIDSINQLPSIKRDKVNPWSIALGHVWHLRSSPGDITQTDEGVFVRLGYALPIANRLSIRAEIGYRDHSWYWTANDREWLSYSESISITSPSGTTSIYRFGSSYNQFRSLSAGVELSTNLGRLAVGLGARYSYVHGQVSSLLEPADDPLNPFNDFRPTLLRRHDWSLTGSLRFLIFNRLGIQASGQLGLTDLSPDNLWESPAKETSSALELGLFYKF